MNRSFGENLRRTGQFATHFVTLTSDVEKFGANLDKGQMKLKQYFQTFQQHTKTQGGLIRDLAKQQVALQNAIIQPMGKNAQGLMQYSVHIPQGLDAVKNKTALAKQELQIMNKVIQDGGVQMINWGKNTQWAGRQLTVGLTVPLAAFGKAAADAFRMADAELTRLTKVYGGIAATSASELSKIRNEVSATAKEISKSYGVSFKDTITLAADIAATGKQGNDLLASVKETSRLAVLGEVDRQDAMKATLAIQNTFKQNTDQLSESINFLNAVENQTSTSLADLIEAIPKAGPVIQGMGGSVKDLALYLTAMKEGGVNAAEGANALKSALASLINPTKVASEKFAAMGIDLGGIVTKNAGNLTGTILELQKALDSLDPLQKQQAIEQLFGKFQFARMNALFANLGKQGSQTLQVMDLMKASSQELAGVAGRELGMVTESASGKYRRALEGLKADLAGMGEEFLKVQTFFINVTDGILKFVNALPGPVKSILTFVTGLTAIIGPVIMLTGVLANFFGYIIKGASHFKSLFKGGEGWKMLTPEILAAQKAGSLVEATFYSDAKAATVLKTAIAGLVTEFELLQGKAMTGAVSVGPSISTMAGNMVTPGGMGRVVNPNHPLISAEDTRSMSHLNPVAGMSTDAKAAQTIFGVVPGAPKVNQKIGNNPQMYMSGDLPKIQGLTSIGGASTGIVAEEAAKWHAMTGALAMQSEAEIALLKKEVNATGLITTELSDSYQALLPTMTKLTANAATESAAIVAELQAGKLTVDQARAKIIALNAQVETMIAQASTDIAGQQGRSIGLTTVPLLNQPVVNKDGKTNMKELTRPGRTRDLLNKIARGLGVKTFGAGYSTETTIPKRFATGGVVYRGQGSDGPEFKPMGTDTIPAMLTEGEFVVNAKATKENLPLLQAINSNATPAPGTSFAGSMEDIAVARTSNLSNQEMRTAFPDRFTGKQTAYDVRGTAGIYLGEVTDPKIINNPRYKDLVKNGKISKETINAVLANRPGLATEVYEAAMKSSGHPHVGSTDQFLSSLAKSGIINPADAAGLQKEIDTTFKNRIRYMATVRDEANPYWHASDKIIQKHLFNNPDALGFWNKFSEEPSYAVSRNLRSSGEPMRSPSMELRSISHNGKTINLDPLKATKEQGFFAHAAPPTPLLKRLASAGITSAVSRFVPKGWGAYRGSRGRGYANGGMIGNTQYLAKGGLGRLRSNIRGTGSVPGMGGGMDSGAASMGGFGLMMGGQMAGGDLGMGLQIAGMAMQMAPLLKMLKPLVSGFTSVGSSVAKLGTIAKTVFTAMRIALAALLTPAGAVVAIVTALGFAIYKNNERLKENAKEQTMLHAVTEKGAKQAGIAYNNISDSIKNVKNQLELAKAASENAFNAQNSSGVAGLTLTIAELQNKIKAAKTEMSEFVDVLNKMDQGTAKNNKMTLDLAANWKATWVAGGKSAQDATNEIYAIVKASDQANHAFEAITSGGFKSITDRASALSYMFKDLNTNMTKMSGEDLGNALGNLVVGLDNAVDALSATKDAAGNQLGHAKAMEETLKNINSIEGASTKLKQEQIDSLKQTYPALAKILNTSDDIKTVYSKWRLLVAGIDVDLKKLTGSQAAALAQFIQLEEAMISAAETSTEGQSGYIKTVSKSGAVVKQLNDQIAKGGVAGQKAAQRTKDQIDAEIKAIDKRIKKIQEEADARIKAIQKTQDAESYAVELKQAQLDLQSAIASGDKEAQVRAGLALSALQKRHESEMSISAIQDDAAAKTKALEAEKTKKQEEIDALNKKVAASQSRAANITVARDQVVGFQQQYEGLLKRQGVNDKRAKDDPLKYSEGLTISKDLSTLANAISKGAKGSDKDLAKALKDAFGGTLIDSKTSDSLGGKVTQAYNGGTMSSSYQTGLADVQLKSDSKAMVALITISNSHLANIETLLGGKDGSGSFKSPKNVSEVPVYDTMSMKSVDKNGELSDQAREDLIRKNKYKKDTYFEYGGKKYRVNNGYDSKLHTPGAVVVSKELGGPFAAGQLIEVNDRINPLGGQQEGMLIRPDFSGVIYPNAATMPKYDIPSGGYRGSTTTYSSGSGGSAPVINNYITAGPNMDIKQLAREVGMVTAKAVSRGGNNRGYSNGTQQVVNV
jgi:TP901 family phage tail tape measure protein